MSAFVVNPDHINALLSWANTRNMGGINLPSDNPNEEAELNYSFNDFNDLNLLANILYRQNYASVNYRYQTSDETPEIKFRFMSVYEMSPIQVIKACECYDYQACETPDYRPDVNAAARIISWIKGAAISKLPGYDDAEWELRNVQPAKLFRTRK